MALNDAQYERIARRLDGQDVELSEQERMAAEQIRRRQVNLAAMLDVNAPPKALAKARRRMRGAVVGRARPRRRSLYLAVATAAAAVLVAMVYLKPLASSKDVQVPTEVLFSELDRLAEDIQKLEAHIVTHASAGALERTLDPDEFDFQIEALWLADTTGNDSW